jgi:diaminopimelate decarboxylase
MKREKLPKDPDLLGSVKAIRRSAVSALKLARKTNTPCYVVRDGKIVNVAKRVVDSERKKQIAAE